MSKVVNNQIWPEGATPKHGRWHKLHPADRDRIRELYATGEYTQTALANTFGISQAYVGRIVNAA